MMCEKTYTWSMQTYIIYLCDLQNKMWASPMDIELVSRSLHVGLALHVPGSMFVFGNNPKGITWASIVKQHKWRLRSQKRR